MKPRSPIARRTPLPRKRKTPRKYKTPRCDYTTPTGRRTCKKPQKWTWTEHDWTHTYMESAAIRAVRPDPEPYFEITATERGMCDEHAKAEAHARIREFVRERDGGRCVIPHQSMFPCAGPWQPNHGFDRDEKACTWAEWNVMGGCGAINTWAHHHKLRWYAMLRDLWGRDLYEFRHEVMLHGEPMNVADVLANYPPAQLRDAA